MAENNTGEDQKARSWGERMVAMAKKALGLKKMQTHKTAEDAVKRLQRVNKP